MTLIQPVPQHLELIVSKESLERFTSLLQSGVCYSTPRGTSLGVFLNGLPGFSKEYIIDRVQTIFLDGNAVDDLETPITKNNSIIAISAAMPGLAGAIFRKNSLHAALRTQHEVVDTDDHTSCDILVTLKFFNMIAREKGTGILEDGVIIAGKSISTFISNRTSLLKHIFSIKMNDTKYYPDMLLNDIADISLIHLRVKVENE